MEYCGVASERSHHCLDLTWIWPWSKQKPCCWRCFQRRTGDWDVCGPTCILHQTLFSRNAHGPRTRNRHQLVISCPQLVSSFQHSGKLNLDAHSPRLGEGAATGQPVGPGMASSSPLCGSNAIACGNRRANSVARYPRRILAAPPLGTGGGRTIVSIPPRT